jgi:hypothetical protein
MVILLITASVSAASVGAGYLLSFEADSTGCRYLGGTVIASYRPHSPLPAGDDWHLALHDPAGATLWQTRLSHPWYSSATSRSNATARFSVKVPQIPGAASAILSDHTGQEQVTVVLDAAFVAAAESAQQRFLTQDRDNQARLLKLQQQRRQKTRDSDQRAPRHRYEHLGAELQAELDRQIADDHELLSRYGTVAGIPVRDHGRRRSAAIRYHIETMLESGSLAPVPSTELTLSGTVRNAETGDPVANAPIYFTQYTFQNEYLGDLGVAISDRDGYYSIAVTAGFIDVKVEAPMGELFAEQQFLTSVLSDTTLDISLLPGVELVGLVLDADGNQPVPVSVRAEAPRFWAHATSSSDDNSYHMVVPKNREVTVWAEPTPPAVAPAPIKLRLFQSTRHDLVLSRGHHVTGTVTDAGGTPIALASVVVKHLRLTSTASPTWSAQTDGLGRFSVAVPQDQYPSNYLLSVYRQGYVHQTMSLPVTGDISPQVTLEPGITVAGICRDSSDSPLGQVMVRAYRDGMYVASAQAAGDGRFSFGLAAGTYSFIATPSNSNRPSPLAPVELTNIVVSEPLEITFTHMPAPAEVILRLSYSRTSTYDLCQGVMRVEVREEQQPLMATYGNPVEVIYDAGNRSYVKEIRIFLEAGTYDLKVYPLGSDPFVIPAIEASGDVQVVEYTIPAPYTWTGDLRSADGTLLPNTPIRCYDDLTLRYVTHTTDQSGHFTIPMTPNGVISFASPETGRAMRHVERLGTQIGSRNEDCILDMLPEAKDGGAVLTQIWGGTENLEGGYNLVILGDGYTGIDESFDDLNENGVWDGVLYYDLNGNGIYDGYPEQYSVYGDALPPQIGTDPTVDNEPFSDLNGDGFLNIDEQTTFDDNAAALTRSLLGSDAWQEHKHALNVYRLRIISEQAGHDILDAWSAPLVQRRTALNTLVYGSGDFQMVADDGMVQQIVNRYAPFADTQIVLVNQPIAIGRPNSYIITRGGRNVQLANSYLLSHELGHKLAHLDDEYTELDAPFLGPERRWVNVTTASRRDQIPWYDLIDLDHEIPSRPLTPGVGLYEGAYYHPTGTFRPTEHCTMRGGERFCPVCRRQITLRIAGLTRQVPEGVELIAPIGSISSFCPVFLWGGPENASHYQLELYGIGDIPEVFNVHATNLDLGCVLSQAVLYRWRVRPGLDNTWGDWSDFAHFLLPAFEPDGVAAGVAAVAGLANSDWHSDLWLHNAGAEAAAVRLYYSAKGDRPNPTTPYELVIAPGATAALIDVVDSTFATSGSGAISWKVTSGASELLLVEGRTYNRLSSQLRYGHGVYGMRWAQAAPAETVHYLPVAAAGRYRTNLDFAADSDCGRVRLVIHEPDGTVVVDKTMAVASGSWNQIVDVVDSLGLDPEQPHWAELIGVNGRIIAGNSMIDNLSNDASRMQAQNISADATAEPVLWIPGAAYLSGSGGSQWRSDLTIISSQDAAQSCSLAFVPRGAPWHSRSEAALDLLAGTTSTVENVLSSLFDAADGSAGSLRLCSSGASQSLMVFMRTYNLEQNGSGSEQTFGQYVAPWHAADTISAATEGRIIGLDHNATSRTNLLLQHTAIPPGTGKLPDTEVTVEIIATDGQVVAADYWTLMPAQGLQINGIAERLLGEGAELDGFIIRVTTNAQTHAGVVAVASEVNGNTIPGTNDPRLIRAHLLPRR